MDTTKKNENENEIMEEEAMIETIEDNNTIQPLAEPSSVEITFIKGSDNLYSYTVEHLVGVYLVKFKIKNPELKVYSKDSSGNRYFVDNVKIPQDESSILFKLDISDDVILEFVTSHEVEYAEVKY